MFYVRMRQSREDFPFTAVLYTVGQHGFSLSMRQACNYLQLTLPHAQSRMSFATESHLNL
jgi:hypothetical protein